MASLAAILLQQSLTKPLKREADQADSALEGALDICLPHCTECLTKKTPLWRWDPAFSYGIRRLCNACGCAAARKARKGYGKLRRESSEGTDRDHWGGDWGSVSSSDDEGNSPINTADTQPRKLRTRRSGSLKAEAAAEWLRDTDGETACEEGNGPTQAPRAASGRPQRSKAAKMRPVPSLHTRRQCQGRTASKLGKENAGSLSHRKRARKQSRPMRAE